MAAPRVEMLEDWLLVEAVEGAGKTPGGILLPDSAKKKGTRGRILSTGPGRIVDGHKAEMVLGIGDVVLYGQWSGCEIEIAGVEYRLLRQSDVMARLPK